MGYITPKSAVFNPAGIICGEQGIPCSAAIRVLNLTQTRPVVVALTEEAAGCSK
jgi:hypothetical protein